MAYTTIDNPELYFQAKLYTGNSGTQSITFDGSENMQPDWVWIKSRSAAEWHQLHDSVRGVAKYFFTNTNGGDNERSPNDQVTSFNSNGFSLGAASNDSVNTNSATYVSWNWKAGTSFTNDASSTGVGSIDSSGSINTTAGFSIISYTGTGSAGTVAHGLGVAPSLYIVKNRSSAQAWRVFVSSLGADKILRLSTTHASSTDTSMWNNTSPTSSVFSIGTPSQVNTSGENYIAYCFAEKKGYSKIGTYIGNGNADGTFVYTGFKPAMMIFKPTSTTGNWFLLDNKRDTINPLTLSLFPNLSDAETGTYTSDFLSNGIKIRLSGNPNSSGVSYIYMAFAESPFVSSTGIPTTAR